MRTLDQSASISSAMISGSDVVEPCPISVAGDMMEMVPSLAMLTQGPSDVPAISEAGAAANASSNGGSATAKVNPAAPIITWRRDGREGTGGSDRSIAIGLVMAQA